MNVIELLKTRYTNCPIPYQHAYVLVSTLLGGLFLAVLIKMLCILVHHRPPSHGVPMLIRQGEQFIVPEESPLRSKLVVKTVIVTQSPAVLPFPAMVEADPARTINILPPLSGRLFSLNVKLGEQVKAGQVLAVMSSPDLAQAVSENEKADAAFHLATEALKRTQSVNQAGANAIKDIEQAQNNYNQAQFELAFTQARLKTLNNNSEHFLSIIAPLSGTITALNIGEGSYITDPTAVIMTLSNLDQIWVTANIPENFVAVIAENQEVDVHFSAYPNQSFHGKISFISPLLDPDTHRNKTRITFSNLDGKFQPNMFAMAYIAVPQSELIVIPKSAILMNDDRTNVFVETAPWIFARREVVLGLEEEKTVRILSGLSVNDRVVVRGGILIND